MKSPYLSLTEYSSKYGVSISTLRRRIKASDIKYVFQDGKYLIVDEPVVAPPKVHRPSPKSESTGAEISRVPSGLHPELQSLQVDDRQEPILSAANRLLTELKKAYTQVLQEKEEQILQLHAEISDLKTLVRALEKENEKRDYERAPKGRGLHLSR